METCVQQAVIGQYLNDQRPKRETMPIGEATYDKIKDQIVTKQKSLWGLGRGIEINH